MKFQNFSRLNNEINGADELEWFYVLSNSMGIFSLFLQIVGKKD